MGVVSTVCYTRVGEKLFSSGDDHSSEIKVWVEKHATEIADKVEGSRCLKAPVVSNIGFSCKRTREEVDSSIKEIYDTIVEGNSHLLLEKNPNECRGDQVSGPCGHFRGALSECRCEVLDRIGDPVKSPDNYKYRMHHEDSVIATVETLIKYDKVKTTINMAMFGTGGLHGELVLLFRLIEKIKGVFRGTINVYLIDDGYRSSVQDADRIATTTRVAAWPLIRAVGENGGLAQFLDEIAKILPRTIQLSGAVFASAQDYIERARSNVDADFRHDLLIGADIETPGLPQGILMMNDILNKTSRTGERAIVLCKLFNDTVPAQCLIPLSVNDPKQHCVRILPTQAQAASQATTALKAPSASGSSENPVALQSQ